MTFEDKMSLAMSVVTLTHYYIDSFTTFTAYNPPLVRTEELLLRAAEMAVFTAAFGLTPLFTLVFRSHEGRYTFLMPVFVVGLQES